MPSTAPPDIDRIVEAIRIEARLRAQSLPPDVPRPARAEARVSYGLPALDVEHVADYLALPLDVFVHQAYARILGRAPDSEGAVHYQRMLLRSQLTRIDVLARIAYSPEGREKGRPLPGLAIAALFAAVYHIPLLGPALSIVARALRLPSHLQDCRFIETAAVASGGWMKR